MNRSSIVDSAKSATTICLLCALIACTGKPVTKSDAIGRYEYHSGNKAQGTTCFILNPEGTYVLGDAKEPLSDMSMGGTPPQGTWQLRYGAGRVLWIGRASGCATWPP